MEQLLILLSSAVVGVCSIVTGGGMTIAAVVGYWHGQLILNSLSEYCRASQLQLVRL